MAPAGHQEQSMPESIQASVRGYAGYAEAKYRSKSDAKLRESLERGLNGLAKDLGALASEVTEGEGSDISSSISKIEKKLCTMCESLQNPTYFNSSFFEKPSLSNELLQCLYDHEVVMLSEVANLREEVAALKQGAFTDEELSEYALRMDDSIDAFNQALFERESLLVLDEGGI